MSRRLSRISLALVILVSSEVWALGLGDIRMNSALNEPLNAEIELLSATPGELDNLTVVMAAAETFDRYGIDRPLFLQDIRLNIVRSGSVDGNYVQVRSDAALAEPFITFLVEASWSRGRLLREYTVFLDPPTFTPRAVDTAPAVQAPTRAEPADSGRIERAAQPPQQARPTPALAPRQAAPFDTTAGGDLIVGRGDTLWGVASRVRPDSRLTMNQIMLTIFEANPNAFGGNINILRAGAVLRIPSADEVYRISRGDAFAEAQRQNAEWSGGTVPQPVAETSTRPSLTLVPPDDDFTYEPDTTLADPAFGDDATTRETQIEQRIAELEGADVPQQRSLIEIRDSELARLREELASIRGEVDEPPVDVMVDDSAAGLDDDLDPFADPADSTVDDAEAVDVTEPVVEDTPPSDIIRTPTRSEPGLIDRAIEMLTSIWAIIIAAVVLVAGALVWFLRRRRDDAEDPDDWPSLDSDEAVVDDLQATERMSAPVARDESIVVVEQESTMRQDLDETVEVPAPEFEPAVTAVTAEETGRFDSLEDTFSSESAINLDQSDPIAEADFHMAYGLYDQAADLINGALSVDPERVDLLTKICEIYFIWGNREAFVDAARRLNSVVGGDESADWDKIVIMGQQIAADDALFAGASAAGAMSSVDLSFDPGMDGAGAPEADDGVDFFVDGVFADSADEEPAGDVDFDITREIQSIDETEGLPGQESTVETPTIEQPFDVPGGTSELPSLDEAVVEAIESSGQAADETAEINLDDLNFDVDVDSLAETELASLDDLDVTGELEKVSDTGINKALDDQAEATGKNPEIDPNSTGVHTTLTAGYEETVIAADVDIEESLLSATGMTQVLSDDMAIDTAADTGTDLSGDDATMLVVSDDDAEGSLDDDVDTMLGSLDDDGNVADSDFAKTKVLPDDASIGEFDLDATGDMPAVASKDADLDDLAAALKVSEVSDTAEQLRDEATVEQPQPKISEDAVTLSLAPDDMGDDLSDARTMTEVGTKLDLARAYVDMGDPNGARSILEEVLDEGDESQRQQAQQLLDLLPS